MEYIGLFCIQFVWSTAIFMPKFFARKNFRRPDEFNATQELGGILAFTGIISLISTVAIYWFK